MSDCTEFLMDILEALKSLAESVSFLFSGLSFGLIPTVRNIEHEADNIKFRYIIGRTSQSLYAFYLIMMLIFALYYDYDATYNLIMGTLALLFSVWFQYLIKQNKSKEVAYEKVNELMTTTNMSNEGSFLAMLLYWISTLILGIRMVINSFFLFKHLLENNKSGEYVFELTQLGFDCFFLLLFTLTLYLPLLIVNEQDKKEGKSILTVWAMEYGDIIAHLIVCILYGNDLTTNGPINSFTKDPYFVGYFIVYCINIIVFSLPLPWISLHAETYHPMIIHTMFLDVITDLPFTIITLAGKTYVGNFFITVDVVVNIVTFIRGIIWVPIKFKTKELDSKKILLDTLKGLGIFVGGLCAFGIIGAPGIWLIINGFMVSNDCHDGTDVNVPWDTWFHITGWSFIVYIMVAVLLGWMIFEKKDDASIFWTTVIVMMSLMNFLMGCIGIAMWDQATKDCQQTQEGYTLILYSIVYTVISPCAGGAAVYVTGYFFFSIVNLYRFQ